MIKAICKSAPALLAMQVFEVLRATQFTPGSESFLHNLNLYKYLSAH